MDSDLQKRSCVFLHSAGQMGQNLFDRFRNHSHRRCLVEKLESRWAVIDWPLHLGIWQHLSHPFDDVRAYVEPHPQSALPYSTGLHRWRILQSIWRGDAYHSGSLCVVSEVAEGS